MASSIIDYLFRRLAVEYLSVDERAELGIYTREERMQPTLPGVEESVTNTDQGVDVISDPKTIPSVQDLVAQMDFAAQQPHAAAIPARTGAICSSCGSANMQRAGACYVCGDCGSSSGCS
jgi:ribonucleoside-diphosphate reductase alpha chain